MNLLSLNINDCAVIKENTNKKLLEMGLVKGAKIQYLHKSLFNFPRIFKVRDFLVALGKNECINVYI